MSMRKIGKIKMPSENKIENWMWSIPNDCNNIFLPGAANRRNTGADFDEKVLMQLLGRGQDYTKAWKK